jgi:hypothetical protein
MYLDNIQKSLEEIKNAYKTPSGGMQDLLHWVQDLLDKELLDKTPTEFSRFDYQGNSVAYACPSGESGYGYFWISNTKSNMEYCYSMSNVLSEQYGMDITDENVKLTILDLKDLTINLVTEFFQFKLYSELSCEGADP